MAGLSPNDHMGGMKGWFNATPAAAEGDGPLRLEEWPQMMLDHPDTVLINTRNDTLVEGYDRTRTGALDVYRDLGPGFAVPDPDTSWPADSLVLIDAATGELLETFEIRDQAPGVQS